MVAIKSLLATTLALLSSQAEATRLFYNSGTLDGWDYIRREHKGTVDQVTNVQYKSGTALKMTQTYDPNYSGRYHSEVDHNDGYNRGDERFYGFMFRVSDKWEFVSQSHNIAQFISHRTGSDNCGDDYMPSTMVWISGNKLQTRLVNGPYIGGNCHRDFVGFSDVATIQPGQWHKVIIQARWEDNDTGYFKMWFDGQKVVERYNVATTVSGNWPFQFRVYFVKIRKINYFVVGLYSNGWYDGGYMEGNQPFRQIWYDEISVGTTYKDVDPDQN